MGGRRGKKRTRTQTESQDQGDQRRKELAGATASTELGGGARDFSGPQQISGGEGGSSTWPSRLGRQLG